MPTKQKAELKKALQLHKVLAHPYRVHALHILSKQSIASPKELALQVGVPVGAISYHVRELAKAGFIELVKTEQRRGATEHYYRATERAHFDSSEWLSVPRAIREDIMGMHLVETGKIVSQALEAGTFEGRAERHCTLLEFDVDEAGFTEMAEALDEALERLVEIRAKCAERQLDGEAERIPVAVSLLGFERATK